MKPSKHESGTRYRRSNACGKGEEMDGKVSTAVHLGAAGARRRATIKDLLEGLRRWRLWMSLGSLDVKQRYRRAVLGPFWITISMSVMVLMLGVLYAGIFKQDVRAFLPYIASGLIVWNFFTATINESTATFVQAEGLIKQGGIPLSLHIFRTIFRNLVINAHNFAVMLPVYVWQPSLLNWTLVLLLPGLALILANLVWISIIASVLCTRFRDLPPIITNLLQMAFFVTPVIYRRDALPLDLNFIAILNPFFYMMEAMRSPMLGHAPPSETYLVLGLLAVLGSLLALWIFERTRARVAYWL